MRPVTGTTVHHGQQPGRGPGQQGSETAGQRQPAPARSRSRWASATISYCTALPAPALLRCPPSPAHGTVAAPVILFNAPDGHTHPVCHLESVREAQCQPGMPAATVR